MNKFLLLAILLFSFQARAQMRLTKDDLVELKNRLEGNFDSQEQSQLDKNFSNISLHIKEISLNNKTKPNLKTKTKTKSVKQSEGIYLYVEQAPMATPEKPSRQCVYFLSRKGDSVLSCQVFEMKEPNRFAGAWGEPSKLSKLTLDSLVEKANCILFFYKNDDGNYVGATRYNGCENNLKGANYATTELSIYPSMIISRVRGFDANDKLVWGNENSGYRYRKFIPLRRKD